MLRWPHRSSSVLLPCSPCHVHCRLKPTLRPISTKKNVRQDKSLFDGCFLSASACCSFWKAEQLTVQALGDPLNMQRDTRSDFRYRNCSPKPGCLRPHWRKSASPASTCHSWWQVCALDLFSLARRLGCPSALSGRRIVPKT